jgi:hypothetical protein
VHTRGKKIPKTLSKVENTEKIMTVEQFVAKINQGTR